jgi:Leucine-rich repeat (LRR) protein
VNQLTLFNNARSIALQNVKITSIDLNLLPQFKSLTSLNLCGNKLSCLPSNCLPHTLQELNLSVNYFSSLPDLHENMNLLHLNLSYNKLSHVEQNSLPCNIKSLHLAFNDVEDLAKFVQEISTLKSLRILSLLVCYSYYGY